MTYSATITQKGQVTIPIDIRRFFDLKPYQKITFVMTKDKVSLMPSKNFLNLKGSLQNKIKYSDRNADKKVKKFIANQYDKKNSRS
jgi:AbrB family looped-hinge helix DNA binding protein